MSASGWEIRFSNSRKLPYFYNASSGASVWERPGDVSEEQVKSLPGYEHLAQLQANAAASASSSSSPAAHGAGGGRAQVRASHLLVKHRGSRRPSSWKEPNITRSQDEAESILRQHLATLGANPTPEKFAELAKVHSDCSSAREGGDLGLFGRGQMQKPFEDATFALPVGGLSDVVRTDSGCHIILRTA